MYELLRKLRFFRHFLLCRTFRRWAANVRRSSFERRRAALGRQLFAVSPTFQAALARAGALVDAMRETAVVAVSGGRGARGPAGRDAWRGGGAG